MTANHPNTQMEVIDDKSGSTKICNSTKSEYPHDLERATGIVTGGKMIVCGGGRWLNLLPTEQKGSVLIKASV